MAKTFVITCEVAAARESVELNVGHEVTVQNLFPPADKNRGVFVLPNGAEFNEGFAQLCGQVYTISRHLCV